MSIKGALLLVAVAAMFLFAAGCGGGDDDSGSDGNSGSGGEVTVETNNLTKAQYVQRANAVCEENLEQLERDLAKWLRKLNADPTAASEGNPEVELVEETFVPTFQRQIDAVSALGAPRGDEERVSKILGTLQREVDSAKADPKAFVRNGGDLGKATKVANAYGLTRCATSTLTPNAS